MVEKKIKALVDFQFTNFTGTHFLVAGEVKRIKFLNQQRFEDHVKTGRMVEADLREPEDKIIPVVFPPEADENTIVSVEPIDPIDPPEGIEPDKPDLPYPLEDRLTLEEEEERVATTGIEPEVEEFEPNAETVEALEESERGEDLHEVESVEELIDELNEGEEI